MNTKHVTIDRNTMLPFLFGGGIFIAIAFALDDFSLGLATFGTNSPQSAFFQNLGLAVSLFVLPTLGGAAAMGVGGQSAVPAGVIGGYLASQGGSGFWGALLVGLLAGYITEGLKWIFGPLPPTLEKWKTSFLKPMLAILAVGIVMQMIVNPLGMTLNTWAFNTLGQMAVKNEWLTGGVAGAMIGLDINGPLSRAAYSFGTASLAGGQYRMMSSVMAAGMSLPIGAGLFALLLANKRYTGVGSIIMGAAFLPDGAMPLAVERPFCTIPAFMIGGSVAGALSMLFRSALHVSMGGAFVWRAMGNRLGFFTAVAAGAALNVVLLWALHHKGNIAKKD